MSSSKDVLRNYADATLMAWESEERTSPRPCPDFLGWIAETRSRLSSVDTVGQLAAIAAEINGVRASFSEE